MHYIVQCHVKMLHTITPQDIYNLILEDTQSAFTGVCSSNEEESLVNNRRDSRKSYRHLMTNMSTFRALLQPLDSPYLVRMRSDEA